MGAFKKSLENHIKSHQIFLEILEQDNMVLVNKKMANFFKNFDIEEDNEEWDETFNEKKEILKNHPETIQYSFEKFEPNLKQDIVDDLKLLREIYQKWEKISIEQDPKAFFLKEKLKDLQNNGKGKEPKKIIIFSEYADTVEHLKCFFKEKNMNIITYTGKDNNEKKKEVLNNFQQSIPKEEKKYDIDILITTDALSEGVDLDRSTKMICYDIPYNPTKIIQRFGRINRVGKSSNKEKKTLFLYHFFPSIEDSKLSIALGKMVYIHNIVGEDNSIIDDDYEDIKKHTDSLFNTEDTSLDSSNENISKHSKNWEKYKSYLEDNILLRAEVALPSINIHPTLCLFIKEGAILRFYKINANKHESSIVEPIEDEEGLDYFESSEESQSQNISWDMYKCPFYTWVNNSMQNFVKEMRHTSQRENQTKKLKNELRKLKINHPDHMITINKIMDNVDKTINLNRLEDVLNYKNKEELIQNLLKYTNDANQYKKIDPEVLFKVERL